MTNYFRVSSAVFTGFVVSLFFILPSVASAAGNLIANPSFELGVGTTVTGWTNGAVAAVGVEALSTTTDAHTGTLAGKVTITSWTSGDGKWAHAPVPAVDGDYFVFSDWYKSDAPSQVAIFYTTPGGAVFQWVADLPAAATWTQFQKDFIVPVGTNASAVQVVHLIASNGTLTTDDYSLESLPSPLFAQGMVSLTFDDGWKSFETNALPILTSAGLKSTEYIITLGNSIAPDSYMSTSSIAAAQAAGHDIAAHTRKHLDLVNSDPVAFGYADLSAMWAAEILGSRSDLLNSTPAFSPVDSFAYPYGAYNPAVENAVQAAGFAGARSVDQGYNLKSTDKYALKMQHVTSSTTVDEAKAWIDYAKLNKVWLIMMFHNVRANVLDCVADADGDPLTPAVIPDTDCTTDAFLTEVTNYLVAQGLMVPTVSQGLAIMNTVTPPVDTTAPVIAAHADVHVSTTSATGMDVTYVTPTATDNVDVSVTVACSPLSGTHFAIGTTTVNCTAHDVAGNNAIPTSFSVVVTLTSVPPVNQAPTITVLGSNPLGLNVGDAYTEAGATAADAEDGDITAKILKTGSVNTAVVGTYFITYSATDTQNVLAQATRTVNVITPVPVTPPASGGGGGGGGAVYYYTSLKINNGALQSSTTGVALSISASGLSQMWIANDASFTTGSWKPVQNTVSWTLAGTQGSNMVYARFGNSSTTYATSQASIVYTGPTTTVKVTPVTPVTTGTVLGTSTTMCTDLLTQTLRFGSRGDQVKALQGFLNTHEGETLPVTGYFGSMTREAVKRFQAKYASIVLTPLGLTTPTGIVGSATRKQINALSCTAK